MSRCSLTIGTSEYSNWKSLPNAAGDARQVAFALEQREFSNTLLENQDLATIEAALDQFARDCRGASLALIYVAGHGVEHQGAGWALPGDHPHGAAPELLALYAIATQRLIDAMQGAKARVLVMDTCRHAVRPDLLPDLEAMRAAERSWDNVLIAYSTSAADRALDGVKGEGGRYANALSNALLRHDLSVEECFREVGASVMQDTRGTQRPWSYSSLNRSLRFSDLPHFVLLQSHRLPLQDEGALFLAAGSTPETVLISGSSSTAVQAGVAGWGVARSRSRKVIVAAAGAPTGKVAWLLKDGRVEFNQTDQGFASGVGSPFGLQVSPDGDLVAVWGSNGFAVFRPGVSKPQVVVRAQTEALHCATFVSPTEVWLAGSQGLAVVASCDGSDQIQELDFSSQDGRRSYPRDINGIASRQDGSAVFVAGAGGLLRAIDSSSLTPTLEVPLEHKVISAAARRQSFVERMDDAHIHRFLFYPETLTSVVRDSLQDGLLENDQIACALAPSWPIVASGSLEGIVTLVDTRDGQLVQQFDHGSGRAASIHGLRFLADGTLAVLGADATLYFHAPSIFGPAPSGPFLGSAIEDEEVFGSGEW